MHKRTIILGLLVAILGLSCSKKSDTEVYSGEKNEEVLPSIEQISPLKGDNQIELSVSDIIGSDNLEEENYLFGYINCIQIDEQQNVHVLDTSFRQIRVFDHEGNHLTTHDIASGQGPGELLRATSFAFSSDYQKVYLFDVDRQSISSFNRNMEFMGRFPANGMYGYLYQSHIDQADVIIRYSQGERWSAPHIIHFTNETGEEIGSFCSRQDGFRERWDRNLQGTSNVYLTQSESTVAVAFGCPLEIRVYRNTGEIIRRFSQDIDFFGTEFEDGEFLMPSGMCGGIELYMDSLLFVFVNDIRGEHSYIYVYTVEGEHLATINIEELDIGDTPILVKSASSDGYLYMTRNNPFPAIVRLSVHRLNQ